MFFKPHVTINRENVKCTLMSLEDYTALKDIIPPTTDIFWLSDPGFDIYYAQAVDNDGVAKSMDVTDRCVVRPMLKVRERRSSPHIKPGTKVYYGNNKWTYLGDGRFLSDYGINVRRFDNKQYQGEESDIFAYLRMVGQHEGWIS